MLTAIIVAAGSSQRMGFDKLFATIAGKPIIAHTLQAFERASSVNETIVVAREDRRDEIRKISRAGNFKKIRSIIAGGERRQDSVRAGLDRLSASTRYVAVHDAARPLIGPEQIERVFAQCLIHGAAALAEPVKDTLKRADVDPISSRSHPGGQAEQVIVVTGSVDRFQVYMMQTPQVFERALIEEAYRAADTENLSLTDEVSAVERFGRKVVLVPNDDFNFKITYPRDLVLGEFVLKQRARAAANRRARRHRPTGATKQPSGRPGRVAESA
jgi:2-C-methyl-D-erythritol 4-phosphate cytidylyltransferase